MLALRSQGAGALAVCRVSNMPASQVETHKVMHLRGCEKCCGRLNADRDTAFLKSPNDSLSRALVFVSSAFSLRSTYFIFLFVLIMIRAYSER